MKHEYDEYEYFLFISPDNKESIRYKQLDEARNSALRISKETNVECVLLHRSHHTNISNHPKNTAPIYSYIKGRETKAI